MENLLSRIPLATDSDDGLEEDTAPFPTDLWNSVKKDYVKDDYYIKGFETLHLLNIRLYDRKLSRLEYQIAVEGNFRGDGNRNGNLHNRLQRLLREYSRHSDHYPRQVLTSLRHGRQ
jgi:hypothetical protein